VDFHSSRSSSSRRRTGTRREPEWSLIAAGAAGEKTLSRTVEGAQEQSTSLHLITNHMDLWLEK
jgi:hypothetical protein